MSFNLKVITRSNQAESLQNASVPANFVTEAELSGHFATLNGERVLILNGGCVGRYPCTSSHAEDVIIGVETPIGLEIEPEALTAKERFERVCQYGVDSNCSIDSFLSLPCILLAADDAFDSYPEATYLSDIFDTLMKQYGVDRELLAKADMFRKLGL